MSFYLRQFGILALVIVFAMVPQFIFGETIASILEDAGVLHSFSYSFPPDSYGWYYNEYWDRDSLGNDNELSFYYSLFYFDPWPYEQGVLISRSSDLKAPQPDFVLDDHIAVDNMDVYKAEDYTSKRVRRTVPRWHMPEFWHSCFHYSPVNHRIKVTRGFSSTPQSGRSYHFYSSLSGGTVPGTTKISGRWNDKETVGSSRYPKGYGLKNFQNEASRSPGIHSTTTNGTYTKHSSPSDPIKQRYKKVKQPYKGTATIYTPSDQKRKRPHYSPSGYKETRTPVYKKTKIPVYKKTRTPVYKKTKTPAYRPNKSTSYKREKTPSYKKTKPAYKPTSYREPKPSYSYQPAPSSYKASSYSNPARQVTPYGGTSGSYQGSTARTSRY